MHKRLMMTSVAAVAGALGFGGWSVLDGPDHPFADEVAAARSTWETGGVDDYTIVVELHCYCSWYEVTATVVDGRVTEAVDQDGNPIEPHRATDVATVEGLLDTAAEASELGSLEDFAVDPTLGSPTLIDFEDEDGVDHGGGWYVVHVTV
jgi:hypothetical protein